MAFEGRLALFGIAAFSLALVRSSLPERLERIWGVDARLSRDIATATVALGAVVALNVEMASRAPLPGDSKRAAINFVIVVFFAFLGLRMRIAAILEASALSI
jgi:hypothetical protein